MATTTVRTCDICGDEVDDFVGFFDFRYCYDDGTTTGAKLKVAKVDMCGTCDKGIRASYVWKHQKKEIGRRLAEMLESVRDTAAEPVEQKP